MQPCVTHCSHRSDGLSTDEMSDAGRSNQVEDPLGRGLTRGQRRLNSANWRSYELATS